MWGAFHRVNVMEVLKIFALWICITFAVFLGADTQPSSEAETNKDLQALLEVKKGLVDSSGVLDSWDSSISTTPCSWTGIVCRARDVNTSQPVVVSLVLRNSNLSGTISPSISELIHLEILHLGTNRLTGEIPSEIGELTSLTLLHLGSNRLSGSIPSAIGNLVRLEEAVFDDNDLRGEIPSSVVSLVSCGYFSVQGNRELGGTIPAGLRRIPELNLQNTQIRGPLPYDFYANNSVSALYISNLDFSGSAVPEFRLLPSLRRLYMRNTSRISARISPGLENASSLEELDISENKIVGEIPDWIAVLPNLKVLLISDNNLEGPIPGALGRNSSLTVLDVSMNNLNGTVPEGLCASGYLEGLNLSGNSFDGSFHSDLSNCTSLIQVSLSSNGFTGELPSGFGSSTNLSSLDFSHNAFSGSIPLEYGKLEGLIRLDLSHNLLSGPIPQNFGSLLRLQVMDLSSNFLTGSLPPQVVNCKELETVQLERNRLTGPVPVKTLQALQLLVNLNLADNRLEGAVDPGLKSLSFLKTLNFSSNSLSGTISSDLGELSSLQSLDMSKNRFSGRIPDSLGGLGSLKALDLSFNSLSGPVLSSVVNLEKLMSLNLSYNMFSGPLPSGGLSWPTSSFIGNDELCVRNCSPPAGPSGGGGGGLSKGALAGIIIGSIVGAVALLGVIVTMCLYCCTVQTIFLGRARSVKLKNPVVKPFIIPEIFKGYSYPDIMAATRNLSEDYVIGRGGYGTVYSGEFPSGMTCAVKQMVLEQGSSRSSFQTHLREVEIAGQTRHKHIVNLMGFCQKGDETLIVYEFMPNGSLGDALHRRGRRGTIDQHGQNYGGQSATFSTGNGDKLNWRKRFQIICGAATGLSYMHNECRPPITHNDIKSNNILLDSNMEARITDFGMAKMVENAGVSIPNMALVTGSAGYLAPEYYRNMKITDKSDVYSFGVVILECLTGMYPTESGNSASDDFSLVEYVISTLRQEGVLEAILDTALQEEVIESQRVEEQMTLVLQIGLLSTMEDPPQRPSMREVVEMLEYSKGEHGKRLRVPDLGDLLQDLTASPPMTPRHL